MPKKSRRRAAAGRSAGRSKGAAAVPQAATAPSSGRDGGRSAGGNAMSEGEAFDFMALSYVQMLRGELPPDKIEFLNELPTDSRWVRHVEKELKITEKLKREITNMSSPSSLLPVDSEEILAWLKAGSPGFDGDYADGGTGGFDTEEECLECLTVRINECLTVRINDKGGFRLQLPPFVNSSGVPPLVPEKILEKVAQVVGEGTARQWPALRTEMMAGEVLHSAYTGDTGKNDWPYAKRLGLAKKWFGKCSKLFVDDHFAAVECLANFLRLPRQQTEPFRAVAVIQWHEFLAAYWDVAAERAVNGKKMPMAKSGKNHFVSERSKRLMKFLSSDHGGEGAAVRAFASCVLTRMELGVEIESPTTNAANYLRKFTVLMKYFDPTELMSAFTAVTGGEKPLIKGRSIMEMFWEDSNGMLTAFQGPAKTQVSSIYEYVTRHPFDGAHPYFMTVGGGYCDSCGKTAEESNLPILFKCKTCRQAWYCSTSCQAKCWSNGHREHCKKFGCFDKGDHVVVVGLKKRADLNDALVVVEGQAGANGRVPVCVLRGLDAGTVVSIKKENLRHHRPLK
eukprot:CAMPEP_0185804910 /NCGR_PEP_ID=MMETSP1322-20130828/3536_1 /TAXON_ID=265543 /ORGANISM="Minutocellus polymorphus, Strain RCC2270" /LENGTH=565 /DNA_ID=CAMNT_0028500907 /DNA_START=52 /DNA_END=1749 /DNA_ORIENTATION=+